MSCMNQGLYCTGKTEKMANKFPIRNNNGHLELLTNLVDAQVVHSLIPKIKDIAVFSVKLSLFV